MTPVTDMKVVHGDLVLSTMGRGFWIMDNIAPLHALDDRVAGAAHTCSRARHVQVALRRRLPLRRGLPRPAGPSPLPAPTSTTTLPKTLPGRPRWTSWIRGGTLVRSFSSEGAGELVIPAEPGMREWQLERFGTPRLPASAGAHRFTWDLSHPGPWDANPMRAGRGGPMVPPGTYTARLSAGDWSSSRTFEVLLDPRVVAEGIGEGVVHRQVDLALQARDALSEARLAVHRISEARNRGGGNLAAEVEAIEQELVTAPRRYSRPMLVDQLQYLYGNLTRADQEPGQDAVRRYDQLNTALEEHVRRLERLLRANISDGASEPDPAGSPPAPSGGPESGAGC